MGPIEDSMTGILPSPRHTHLLRRITRRLLPRRHRMHPPHPLPSDLLRPDSSRLFCRLSVLLGSQSLRLVPRMLEYSHREKDRRRYHATRQPPPPFFTHNFRVVPCRCLMRRVSRMPKLSREIQTLTHGGSVNNGSISDECRKTMEMGNNMGFDMSNCRERVVGLVNGQGDGFNNR